MDIGPPVIQCQGCGGPLTPGQDTWTCGRCGGAVPATLGIPDLRPPQASANDREVRTEVQQLCAAFATSSFAELVAVRQRRFSTDDPELLRHYATYREVAFERGRQFFGMIERRMAEVVGAPDAGAAVVIGCGSGGCTAAVAARFRHVVALDPALPDLILAKRAMSDAGVDNVTLVQAYAQRIPLADASAAFVIGENVLEHVFDLDGTMIEVARVLQAEGRFAGDCVNRYNLLRPEPHVRLWGVGYLPRSLQARYVLWRRGFRGYGESVYLPSYHELARALRRGFGAGGRIVFPGVDAYGFPPALGHMLRLIERVPPLAWSLLQVFPAHLALAVRHPD